MTTFERNFDFDMNIKIPIISKMPLLILSTIDLMLALVSVNYFGNPS